MPLMIAALCVLAIAYRFYSKFIATRVMALDDSRVTPAHTLNDGQNYHPTGKGVLFGHHFAAISGAGPLIGPVIAAQFGWAPTFLWLLVGVVIGGAVQDFVVLCASMRRGGKSLAEMGRQEIGTFGGTVTAVAILFIVILALAGLGAVVQSALAESSWGTFTILATIPIAFAMGIYTYKIRKGAKTAVLESTIFGIVLLLLAVWGGQFAQGSEWGQQYFHFDKKHTVYGMMGYGFIASVLPVWLLLCPRDYLSSFMKVGTIAILVAGVLIVNPTLHIPAVTVYATSGTGPVVGGHWFPMLFIVVMCGAISGFHSLVSSGTTPKMISKESHARPIGYGAMLIEALVGIVALIAVASLNPDDYFLINTTEANAANYNFQPVELDRLESEIGEPLRGRTGGAPTLAVGMAQILAATPLFRGGGNMLALWYHFVIMFEALFILTTIDTGTRIARFLLSEFLSRLPFGGVAKKFADHSWWPGTIFSSALVVVLWGSLILTGSFATIWPMFGIANQMLAAIALAIVTTLLIRAGRVRYAWVTMVPMTVVLFTTTYGGVYQILRVFYPMTTTAPFKGWMNTGLIVIMISCAVIIVIECARRCWTALQEGVPERVPGVIDDVPVDGVKIPVGAVD